MAHVIKFTSPSFLKNWVTISARGTFFYNQQTCCSLLYRQSIMSDLDHTISHWLMKLLI